MKAPACPCVSCCRRPLFRERLPSFESAAPLGLKPRVDFRVSKIPESYPPLRLSPSLLPLISFCDPQRREFSSLHLPLEKPSPLPSCPSSASHPIRLSSSFRSRPFPRAVPTSRDLPMVLQVYVLWTWLSVPSPARFKQMH